MPLSASRRRSLSPNQVLGVVITNVFTSPSADKDGGIRAEIFGSPRRKRGDGYPTAVFKSTDQVYNVNNSPRLKNLAGAAGLNRTFFPTSTPSGTSKHEKSSAIIWFAEKESLTESPVSNISKRTSLNGDTTPSNSKKTMIKEPLSLPGQIDNFFHSPRKWKAQVATSPQEGLSLASPRGRKAVPTAPKDTEGAFQWPLANESVSRVSSRRASPPR